MCLSIGCTAAFQKSVDKAAGRVEGRSRAQFVTDAIEQANMHESKGSVADLTKAWLKRNPVPEKKEGEEAKPKGKKKSEATLSIYCKIALKEEAQAKAEKVEGRSLVAYVIDAAQQVIDKEAKMTDTQVTEGWLANHPRPEKKAKGEAKPKAEKKPRKPRAKKAEKKADAETPATVTATVAEAPAPKRVRRSTK